MIPKKLIYVIKDEEIFVKAQGSQRNRKFIIKIIFIIAIIFLLIPVFSSTSLQYTNTSEVVIAFDESHNQFCRFNDYKGNFLIPLILLNMTSQYQVKIIGNGSSLTPLNLIGVDILAIGNPGINSTYNQTELNTLSCFVLNGGSLLIMSEGYVENRYPLNASYPNTRELNKILKAVGLSFVEFTNETIKDDSQWLYYYVGDTHQIPIPSSSFSPQYTIGSGINMVLTFGSHINLNPFIFSNNIIATGRVLNFGSYILPLSSTDTGTMLPIWLAGFELFTGSRILLCGSTMMFSDLIPRETYLPWYFAYDTSDYGRLFGFPSFDNAKLWMNMFDWLSMAKNKSFLPMIVTFFAIIVGVIGIGFSLFIYARKTKSKEIKFEVTETEKVQLPIILERAETLKLARQCLRNGLKLKAVELYRKASKLSLKIMDRANQKKFNKKSRDLSLK